MLTLRDLQIQTMIYNELLETFRIWARPTNMLSRISSDLLSAERRWGGGGPLYGLYEYVPRDIVDRF